MINVGCLISLCVTDISGLYETLWMEYCDTNLYIVFKTE